MLTKITIKTASTFSIILFAPVIVTFLLPVVFLLPAGVFFSLIAIFDPTVPLSSAAAYDMWIVAPVLIAFGLFFVGRGLFSLLSQRYSTRVVWLATWGIFSFASFLALWIGLTILTSVGASETPPLVFLCLTALFAAVLTLSAQIIVIPWLVFVSRMIPGPDRVDLSALGKKIDYSGM